MKAPDLRFGVSLPGLAGPGIDPAARAREVEELGFDLVTMWDHLHGDQPSYETWTMLTWVAAGTSRVQLLPTVLGLPYRPPPVVAKMAETLDRLSGGRLILGLGGGGSDAEFEAFGLAVRRPVEKIQALAEAIEILRGLWTEPTFSYAGRHFHVSDARIEPKPERPIPIWTGSYGRRSLSLTGRLADGWNPSMPYAPPEVARGMREVVRKAAVDAGRDPDEVTCSYNVAVRVEEGAAPRPRMVSGSSEEVAEQLAGFARMGFTTLIFWPRGEPDILVRLAEEVIPWVRASVG
jgi:probable F420-dependent oxidoreductase